MKHAAYATVFDGFGQFMMTIPTSFDVGYKYIAVSDGYDDQHYQLLRRPLGRKVTVSPQGK